MLCACAIVVLCVLQSALGLNNGLGKLPGLGWNSDYCDNCTGNGFQNERYIKSIVDFIHTRPMPGAAGGETLQQLGYHYVNMDAGWNLVDRDKDGNLVPDPRQWPSGLQHSVTYAHSVGLGFGLYGDRGTKDCSGRPGAFGHEMKDAEFLANYQIDWYKEDSCYAVGSDSDSAIAQYAKMRDALNATGRPIWFALCGWKPFYASDPKGGAQLANSARIGPDTGPNGWVSVMQNVVWGASVSQFAGPTRDGGYWNDGSLQLTPGLNRGDAMHYITRERHRSQFSLWSMLAMNILMVGNLSALDDYVLTTWSNPEVLAVNQDPLGRAALIVNNHTELWHPPFVPAALPLPLNRLPRQQSDTWTAGYVQAHVAECGGEPSLQQWIFNVPAPGFFSNPSTKTCLNVENCQTTVIYDGCATSGTTCGGGHGAFHPNEEWFIAATGQVRSNLTGSPCLTVLPSGLVEARPCQEPVPASQTWRYDAAQQTLATGSGLCMTQTPQPVPLPSLTLARPLADNAFAFLFLNNSPSNVTMTCDTACMRQAQVPAGQLYSVRDLWLHAEVARDVSTLTGIRASVPANGSSVVLKLTPQ